MIFENTFNINNDEKITHIKEYEHLEKETGASLSLNLSFIYLPLHKMKIILFTRDIFPTCCSQTKMGRW